MSVGVFPGLLTTVDDNCLSGMFRTSRGDWSAPGPHSFTQGQDKHPWPLSLQITFQRNRRKARVPTSAASHESEAMPCEGEGRRLFPYSDLQAGAMGSQSFPGACAYMNHQLLSCKAGSPGLRRLKPDFRMHPSFTPHDFISGI